MKKWMYILGGCLVALLVKKKTGERNKPGPVVRGGHRSRKKNRKNNFRFRLSM
mgnify:CR=1 FL=1